MLCMCAYFKHQSSHVLYLHHFSSVLVTCHFIFNIKLTLNDRGLCHASPSVMHGSGYPVCLLYLEHLVPLPIAIF